ncbi:energy transducer TonB [Ekhidna sp. To15]|uniref:energy transducer TonB n=1 Tax=Ekhidna sp. To15 TaxID=3395267 RepID=UPI003F51B123
MKPYLLVLTSFLLSSCGVYITSFRPTVEYNQATLRSTEYRVEGFPNQISPFDNEPLERLVDSINYEGKAVFKILLGSDGTVRDIELKKSNLTSQHTNLIEDAIKDSKWIPFIDSQFGITTVDFWTGKLTNNVNNGGWVTSLWPRPTDKDEL